MNIDPWHIWIIIAVILFILEIFTSGFLVACFGVGCIVAGVIAACGFGLNVQIISFSVTTLLSLFLIRPFITKWLSKKSDKIKTNVEALIGETGIVTVTVDNSKNTGRVKVQGDDWRAESLNGEILDIGTKIEVTEIKSTTLIVKYLN